MNDTSRAGRWAGLAMMVTAGACAAGCAAGPPQAQATMRPAVAAHPAAVSSGLPAPGSRCRKHRLKLRPGERVPAAYLAAVQFLSPASGVGVTESKISCMIGPGGGALEDMTPWPVVSADGGRTWRAAGGELPRWLQPGVNRAQLAFAAPGAGWLTAGGALAFTSDGGRHWRRVIPRAQVAELASGGSIVAALAVQRDGAIRVWRLSPGSSRHRQLPPVPGPPLSSQAGQVAAQSMAIAARSGQLVLNVPGAAKDRLIAIGRTGRPWAPRTEPCLPGTGADSNNPLAGFQALVAAPGGLLGAVCGHGVGMEKGVQSFLLSRDGGQTWQRRSAEVPGRADPSGMPFGDLAGVASPAGPVFYIVTGEEVKTSIDGGSRWRSVVSPDIPGNGSFGAEFSFLGRRHGWLLLPGEGLLRTTNGRRWVVLGKLAR